MIIKTGSFLLLLASIASGAWAVHKTVDCLHAATAVMQQASAAR